jgi:hypothetical protein
MYTLANQVALAWDRQLESGSCVNVYIGQPGGLRTFCFGKICAETLNLSLPKKLDLRKTKLFCDRTSSFCSTYPNICDRTKKMDYRQISECYLYGKTNLACELLPDKFLTHFPSSHSFVCTVLCFLTPCGLSSKL